MKAIRGLNVRPPYAIVAFVPASQSVLIFGSAGQLGVELVRVFTELGHEVQALTRTDADLAQPQSIADAIRAVAPAFVVNSAAYNLVDRAESEPEAAFAINALAVCAMAKACQEIGARLLHFSTDYVFDGDAGRPYTETDETHPIGAYGVSKLAGEFYARAYLEDALIVRPCGVFGPAGRHTPGGNFPELMLRFAKEGKPLRVVNDAIVSPTYAPALAERSAKLLLSDAVGVFHIGGGEALTWYEYARLIFQAAGLNPAIEPVDRTTFPTAARRPLYSALSNARMESAQVPPMPKLTDALADLMQRR